MKFHAFYLFPTLNALRMCMCMWYYFRIIFTLITCSLELQKTKQTKTHIVSHIINQYRMYAFCLFQCLFDFYYKRKFMYFICFKKLYETWPFDRRMKFTSCVCVCVRYHFRIVSTLVVGSLELQTRKLNKKYVLFFFFPENMIVFLVRSTSLENITFSYSSERKFSPLHMFRQIRCFSVWYMNLWILWVYVNHNFHDQHSTSCPGK